MYKSNAERLLGRPEVELCHREEVKPRIHANVVAVTGAGGSIGGEICRQLCEYEPYRLLLIDNCENNLFQIERELKSLYPRARITARLADVTDDTRIDSLFAAYVPNVVFHAAAFKHVPMTEENAGEAIKTNVFGTVSVVDAADRYDAEHLVLFSTDKAINPSSVMGATKRVAENYVKWNARLNKDMRAMSVRCGNVLGSSGSVIPLFEEQAKRGGPMTVTHAEMTRYFMSKREAAQLALCALIEGQSGDVLTMQVGEPVNMVDMAKRVANLYWHDASDIEIQYTGIRPGERLSETLVDKMESVVPSTRPHITVTRDNFDYRDMKTDLARTRQVVDKGESECRDALRYLVPGYQGST